MIEKLALSKGFWPILALDHGLTVGQSDSVVISRIPQLLEDCAGTIGAVVMTYGLARYAGYGEKVPVVIQCFGAPAGHPKVQVCSVENARDLGTTGVAVQVDFSLTGDNMLNQLRSIAKFSSRAHSLGLPVLFMVAPHEMRGVAQISHSIRFCIELGADIIKVRCNTLSLDQHDRLEFSELLTGAPPVLLAGGTANKKITQEVSMSRSVGFSGYCIGRNIYQAESPSAMSRKLRAAWQDCPVNSGGM